MYIMAKKLGSISEMESQDALPGKYIKAVLLNEDNEINEPVVGQKFFCCRLLTSPVVRYAKAHNGWLVETKNSNYIFMVAELEDIEKMAEQEGMKPFTKRIFIDPKTKSLYWKNLDQEI